MIAKYAEKGGGGGIYLLWDIRKVIRVSESIFDYESFVSLLQKQHTILLYLQKICFGIVTSNFYVMKKRRYLQLLCYEVALPSTPLIFALWKQ